MTAFRRRPRIGVASCFMHADPTRAIFKGKTLLYLEEELSRWVSDSGARVHMIATAPDDAYLTDLIADCDGVVLQGGADVSPTSYGEQPIDPRWGGDRVRDDYEATILNKAMQLDIPVLGACRGIQLINVALGGTLYQDIDTQVAGALVHRDWETYDHNVHEIVIEAGSRLSEVYGGATHGRVNSVHHQAIKDLADGLVVEATSPEDGIIEAVRWIGDDRYVAAVQWHPEWTKAELDLLAAAPLMDDFVDAVIARMA